VARKAKDSGGWGDSAADIRKRRLMNVTLPSGARVVLRTITLDEAIAVGGMPDDLLHMAIAEAAGAAVPMMAKEMRDGNNERVREMSRDLLAMRERLCVAAVVSDEAAAVVEALDAYDREMIADLCQRRINVDAAGRRFGPDRLDTFPGSDPQPAGDAADPARGGEGVDVPEVQP